MKIISITTSHRPVITIDLWHYLLVENCSYVNRRSLARKFPKNKTITLGAKVKILNSYLEGNLDIGDFSCINRSEIGAGAGVGVSSYISDSRIGRFTMVGSRVSIGGFEHPLDWLSVAAFQWGQSIENWKISNEERIKLSLNEKPKYKITEIGADCWVGNNAIIKSGIKLGIGSVVGAGSVVTKNVGDYEVVVGNPARHLKFRFDEKIRKDLIESQWWNLGFENLCTLDFSNPIIALNQISCLRK